MKLPEGYLKMVIGMLIQTLIFIGVIFLSAGRWDYWQGWGITGSYILVFIIFLVLALKNPELVELAKERMHPGGKARGWDKVFLILLIPIFTSIFIIASLDTGRFEWTRPLPIFHYLFSWIFYIITSSFTFWAVLTNKFFSSIVRIQTDRGHKVIQEGPYQYVRHPGYLGGILQGFAITLVLGSYWGLIPALIVTILFVIRTILEDRILQNELSGYKEYTEKVKYRLVPGFW